MNEYFSFDPYINKEPEKYKSTMRPGIKFKSEKMELAMPGRRLRAMMKE